jgi:hypothetical protein
MTVLEMQQFQDSELSPERFRKEIQSKGKPVIIKGLLELYPAKNWSLERLEDTIGQFPVRVFNRKDDNGTSFLRGRHVVPMQEMLDLVRTNSPSDLRMFVSPVLKKEASLGAEFPIPSFFKGSFQLHPLLFLGGKDCIVPLHIDFMADEGLLTQFFGRKEVILASPDQSDLVHRLPFNTISMLNLFEADLKKYPSLKNLQCYHVTLDHGDTLYIPSFYWHQIKYVDASMSVAFRRWNPKFSVTLRTALKRGAHIGIDKSLHLVLNKNWLNWKLRLAEKRANRSIL